MEIITICLVVNEMHSF